MVNPYEGRATQKWVLTDKGNGYHWLRNAANSSLCANLASGPLRLGACGQSSDDSWLFVHAEPGGGYTSRPTFDLWTFGAPYANSWIYMDSPWPFPAWHRWTITDLPAAPAPPTDDPFPPVPEQALPAPVRLRPHAAGAASPAAGEALELRRTRRRP